MNFFTAVTAPSLGTHETIVPKRLPWNAGLKGAQTAWNKGKPHSEQAKARMRATRSQLVYSPSAETRASISAAQTGKKYSPEIRARMLAAATASKGRPVMTYYGPYPSVMAVARAAGVLDETVRKWIKRYPEHYYYINKGE